MSVVRPKTTDIYTNVYIFSSVCFLATHFRSLERLEAEIKEKIKIKEIKKKRNECENENKTSPSVEIFFFNQFFPNMAIMPLKCKRLLSERE